MLRTAASELNPISENPLGESLRALSRASSVLLGARQHRIEAPGSTSRPHQKYRRSSFAQKPSPSQYGEGLPVQRERPGKPSPRDLVWLNQFLDPLYGAPYKLNYMFVSRCSIGNETFFLSTFHVITQLHDSTRVRRVPSTPRSCRAKNSSRARGHKSMLFEENSYMTFQVLPDLRQVPGV